MLISAACLGAPRRTLNWVWERSGAGFTVPPRGIELKSVVILHRLPGGTPGLGRSWAVHLSQRPGGGPTHAELRAWEIEISSSGAEAGSLEGCIELTMVSYGWGTASPEESGFGE